MTITHNSDALSSPSGVATLGLEGMMGAATASTANDIIVDPLPLPGVAPAPLTAAAKQLDDGGATFQRIMAFFDGAGVPTADAARVLRAMAGAISLSKTAIPLPPAMYKAFDVLPGLEKAGQMDLLAIQRVGASERDVRMYIYACVLCVYLTA